VTIFPILPAVVTVRIFQKRWVLVFSHRGSITLSLTNFLKEDILPPFWDFRSFDLKHHYPLLAKSITSPVLKVFVHLPQENSCNCFDPAMVSKRPFLILWNIGDNLSVMCTSNFLELLLADS